MKTSQDHILCGLILVLIAGCSTPQTVKELSQAQLAAFNLHRSTQQVLIERLLDHAKQGVTNIVKAKQAELEQRRDAAKFELLLQMEQDVPERVFEGLEHIQERQRAKILEGNAEALALENMACCRFR